MRKLNFYWGWFEINISISKYYISFISFYVLLCMSSLKGTSIFVGPVCSFCIFYNWKDTYHYRKLPLQEFSSDDSHKYKYHPLNEFRRYICMVKQILDNTISCTRTPLLLHAKLIPSQYARYASLIRCWVSSPPIWSPKMLPSCFCCHCCLVSSQKVLYTHTAFLHLLRLIIVVCSNCKLHPFGQFILQYQLAFF